MVQNWFIQYGMEKNIFKQVNGKKNGFSIIEISIVLAIIGILLSMAFAGYKFYQNTKVTSTKAKMNSLELAIENYHNEVGEYPETLNELIEGPSDPVKARRYQSSPLKEQEIKDAWGKEFDYTKNPKGSSTPYTLSTYNQVAKKDMYSENSLPS